MSQSMMIHPETISGRAYVQTSEYSKPTAVAKLDLGETDLTIFSGPTVTAADIIRALSNAATGLIEELQRLDLDPEEVA